MKIIERIKRIAKARCKCDDCKRIEKENNRNCLLITPKIISEHPFYHKIKSVSLAEAEVLINEPEVQE